MIGWHTMLHPLWLVVRYDLSECRHTDDIKGKLFPMCCPTTGHKKRLGGVFSTWEKEETEAAKKVFGILKNTLTGLNLLIIQR